MEQLLKKVCLSCKKEYIPNSPSQKTCKECWEKICLHCGKTYILNASRRNNNIMNNKAKFCSMGCYLNYRWKTNICNVCNKPIPKDSKYMKVCSENCHIMYNRLNERKRSPERIQAIRNKRLKLIEILGNKCQECGNSDIRVLEFHHKNRKIKDRNASAMFGCTRFDSYLKQIDNIQLLCANCHRIKSVEEGAWAYYKPDV